MQIPRARNHPARVLLTALLLAALGSALVLALGGHDPRVGAAALWRGAFGSRDAILSITLVRSVPLILTGLAVALAFRTGVWNIGAEGQLLAGAIAGTWIGLVGEGVGAALLLPAVLLGGALGGAAWSALPALLRVRWGVGEVVSTLLMNFVALHLTGFMVRGPLQEPRGVFPQTDAVAESARLPILVEGTRLHAGLLLALLLAAFLSVLLRWSWVGFRMRAVGASPGAARAAAEIPVERVVLGSFLASGAVAGLAGSVQVAGVTYALYEGLSPGWGYTAIAVALLGGLTPAGVVAGGIFFGALEAGAGAMQRDAGVSASWVGVVQALVILSVLALGVMGTGRARGGGASRESGVSEGVVPDPRDGTGHG